MIGRVGLPFRSAEMHPKEIRPVLWGPGNFGRSCRDLNTGVEVMSALSELPRSLI